VGWADKPRHDLATVLGWLKVLIIRWRWKLQKVIGTGYLRCTPAAVEKDYDVMYSIEVVHLNFQKAGRAISLVYLSMERYVCSGRQPVDLKYQCPLCGLYLSTVCLSTTACGVGLFF
jgi:hypothetical protein